MRETEFKLSQVETKLQKKSDESKEFKAEVEDLQIQFNKA